MRPSLRSQLLNLVDRRTFIALVTITMLFILAWRGIGATVAIDGLVFVAIGLIGSNSAQRSLIAFAKYKKGGKHARLQRQKEETDSKET